MRYSKLILALGALTTAPLMADTPMLLPVSPALSPDGQTVVFSWNSDLWVSPVAGGEATRITRHPGLEMSPVFSPDGKTLYFNSNREGTTQIWSYDFAKKGKPTQISFNSNTNLLEEVTPDGKNIIYSGLRDIGGRAPYRTYIAPIDGSSPEKLLLDAYGSDATLSPDGTKILFTREGVSPYRKGYYGSQSSQLWMYDIASKSYSQPVKSTFGCGSPLWTKDGAGFFFTQGDKSCSNLWKHDLSSGQSTQLTTYTEDNVMFPVISADGNTILFRMRFHYHSCNVATKEIKKIELYHTEEKDYETITNEIVKDTDDADFSPTGLEIVFSSDGELYTMDTVLREPNRITNTAAFESNVFFGDRGRAIYYLKDDGVETKICKLTRKSRLKFWWNAKEFNETVVVSPEATIRNFSPSPDGKLIAYSTANGKLWVCNMKGEDTKLIAQSWDDPYFDWSPNSKWLAYSLEDNDFNSDIYLAPVDGSQKPVNVTKHPDNEYGPTFSPDGKKLAFLGKRTGNAYSLYYVDLAPQGTDKTSYQKRLEQALNLMKKDPAYKGISSKIKSALKTLTKPEQPAKPDPAEKPANPANPADPANPAKKPAAKKPNSMYDLKNIERRITALPLPGGAPSNFFWHHASTGIFYSNKSTAKSTFFIDLKTKKPAKAIEGTGRLIRISRRSPTYYWITGGVPAVMKSGKSTKYTFRGQTTFNWEDYQRHAFRLIWREMRDGFYDESMNGLNWDAILTKYENAAATAVDNKSFDRIANMLLGELNASHCGYRSIEDESWKKQVPWREEMLHLGVKYNATEKGWIINTVFANGPASLKRSQLNNGDTITHINGTAVNHTTLPHRVLWGQLKDELQLIVLDKEGNKREVALSPISYKAAQALNTQYEIDQTESLVEKLSDGKLGYINVARMQWTEFEKFERHLYEKGAGKEGIVIDVRNNGGGFTADHLMTTLSRPKHSYTIPRYGGPGYPQDRIVYATWDKPIVVLCNQNSFSNAEIFAHAVKTLKRGKVVGVPTAGGVISTGSKRILDTGNLRMPFRGWFLNDSGEDMELFGCVPDHVVWPKPGDLESGKDTQLEKAIEVLETEVKEKPHTYPKAIYRNRK
mgnify:CR=1 FL=1